MIAATAGGASEPSDTLLAGKAGGTVAVRRTLASTICRIADPMLVARPRQLHDASTVMRFRPAHQSMINRRFDDRASCPARKSPKQALERQPQIHLPATWKGGHESGAILTNQTLNFVAPARGSGHWPARGPGSGAHGAMDLGLHREDDRRTPRVTSVRWVPPVWCLGKQILFRDTTSEGPTTAVRDDGQEFAPAEARGAVVTKYRDAG
jgi:hypothetical protein